MIRKDRTESVSTPRLWYTISLLLVAFLAFTSHAQPVKSFQKISHFQGGLSELGGSLAFEDDFGEALDVIGDLDGDGVVDLIVGAQRDDDGGFNRGAVYILFMNPDGTVKNLQKISDTEGGFNGVLEDEDTFGIGATGIGDLDNDGVLDVAVGAARDDDGGTNRGAVYILFLNTDGTVKSHQKISDTEGEFSGSLSDFSSFGGDLEMLGDLDGDGVEDLFVAVSGGAFYNLYLNTDGTVKDWDLVSDLFSGGFGATGALMGDLDGDGNVDLAVGAQFDDDGGTNRGAIWILYLRSDGSVRSRKKISDTTGGFGGELLDGDEFGQSVTTAGDLNRDGIPDLVVGAEHADSPDGSEENTGEVWILLMNRDGTVLSEELIQSNSENFTTIDQNDNLGQAVTFLGDFNNDGINDIAVAADGDGDGGSQAGAVYVIFLEPFNPDDSAANSVPSINNPGVQDSLVGNSIALQISAMDPDGDNITYTALGLPTGLTISPSSGLISGTTAQAGIFQSTVTIADPDDFIANVTFVWNVRSGTFAQQSNASANLLVLEAENYSANITRNGHNWRLRNSWLASGQAYMEALPKNGTNQTAGYVANSPRLDFDVTFSSPGTHYLWVRGFGPDTGSDSVHVGIDGVEVESSKRVDNFTTGEWYWSNTVRIDANTTLLASIDITATGNHTINVWMREDGFQLDKLFLTTDSTFTPTPMGPAPSPHITAGNNAPLINPISDKVITSGVELTIQVTATDNDGPGPMILEVENLPPGAIFNDQGNGQGEFVWTPQNSDIVNSPHNVNIVATDDNGNGAENTESFSIRVDPVGGPNRNPVLENPGDLSGLEGNTVSLQIVATDADGNEITFGSLGLPTGLSISENGLITGTSSESGEYDVTISVNDGIGGSDSIEFGWHIAINNGGVFQQSTGSQNMLVVEAENYSNRQATDTHNWIELSRGSASGGLDMQAAPNTGTNNAADYISLSPRLDYQVQFFSTGTHYLWVRGFSANTGADSVHFGLDGIDLLSSRRIDAFSTGTMSWSNEIQVSAGNFQRATMEIDSTGLRTINVWMREDGFQIDKFLLTTDPTFVPAGNGPGQSNQEAFGNQAPVIADIAPQNITENETLILVISALDADGPSPLTIDALGLPTGASISSTGVGTSELTWTPESNDVTNSPFNITITATDGDGASSSIPLLIVVSAVGANQDPLIINPDQQLGTVDDAVSLQIQASDPDDDPLTYGAQNLPGGLSINSDGLITGVLTTVGISSVTVSVDDSNSGTDSIEFDWLVSSNDNSGAYQQSTNTGNLLVVEAESYSTLKSQGGHNWVETPAVEASNGVAMSSNPNNGSNIATNYVSDSPRIDLDVNFVATGVHYIWVRGFSPNTGSDSVHFGIDGTTPDTGKRFDNFEIGSWAWSNEIKLGPGNLQIGTIDVDSTGAHTLNIWMREDGFQIDKIVLTTDSAFVPNGAGPEESSKGVANQAPVLGDIPAQSVNVADSLTFLITATDSDGPAPLSMGVDNLPAGASFVETAAGTAEFSWTPPATAVANSPFIVTFEASDGDGALGSKIVTIQVLPLGGANNAPVITPLDEQNNNLDDSVSLQVDASDADGHILSFSATGLPDGLNISTNGVFTGSVQTPGNFIVEVTVDDSNGGTDSMLFNWIVTIAPSGEGPLLQSSTGGNLLIIESESFDRNIPGGPHSWITSASAQASGGFAMRASPEQGVNNSSDYALNSPRLNVNVSFVTTGTHYLWVRGFSLNTGADSVHIGLDGVDLSSSRRLDDFGVGIWDWTNLIKPGPNNLQIATIDVSSPGEHTINVWMREDGFQIDKIILTTDPAYIPVGFGPNESSRLVDGGGNASDTDQDGIEDLAEVPSISTTVLIDNFETDRGWTIDPDSTDTATTGTWELAVPENTSSSGGTILQPGAANSGQQALLTEGSAGSSVGAFDVDNGVTSALSAAFQIPQNAQELSVAYYFAYTDGTADDFFDLVLETALGNRTIVSQTGNSNKSAIWTDQSIDISDLSGIIGQIRVRASDGGSGSLVEAGIDDIRISVLGVEDRDSDGIANAMDLDSDGDGLLDIYEVGLADSDDNGVVDNTADAGIITNPRDSDEDGIPDFLDLESNNPLNDGTAYDISSSIWSVHDSNGDGRINQFDSNGGNDLNGNGIDDLLDPEIDDDNDGTNNRYDAFPFDPNESADTDGDGTGDNADAFPNDASESVDTDSDGIGDNSDNDLDADGLTNSAEQTTASSAGDIVIHAGKDGFGYNLSEGSQLQLTRTGLLNTDNFGPSGTVRIDSLAVVDAVSTITPADLAEIDILFDGWAHESLWSNSELDAIEVWVETGGTLISTNDLASYDRLARLFGSSVLGDTQNGWLPNVAHEIANGPFGSWSSVNNVGSFSYLELPDGWTVIATDAFGRPTAIEGEVGNGRVILLGDEGIFRDDSTDNITMVLNIFAYVIGDLGSIGINADADSDGVDNVLDLDSDNDAIPDVVEIGLSDIDGNFMVDDPFNDQGIIDNAPDSDNDGVPDFLDLESDNPANDGTNYDIDTTLYSNLDTNNDGRIDGQDVGGGQDVDGDGIDDLIDPNPLIHGG